MMKILKCNKNGDVTAAKTTHWPTYPGGRYGYFSKTEKLTDNLYAIGASFTKSPQGNPTLPSYCWLKFDTLLNESVTPLNGLAYSLPNLVLEEFYFNNTLAGFLVGGEHKTAGQKIVLSMLDTIGNTLWEREYTSFGNSPSVISIIQSDSCFFILERSLTLTISIAIRKIDFYGNSIFYKEIMVYPPTPMKDPATMDYDENGNILVAGFNRHVFNGWRYPMVIELDTSATVINSIQQSDSTWTRSAFVDIKKGKSLIIQGYYNDTCSLIVTEMLNPTCNFDSLSALTIPHTLADSIIISPFQMSPLFVFYNDSMDVININATNTNLCFTTDSYDLLTDNKFEFSLYPNPSKENISVLLNLQHDSDVEISILNVNGQILSKKSVRRLTGKNEIKIDTSDLPGGIYFVKVLTGGKMSVKKMVKM